MGNTWNERVDQENVISCTRFHGDYLCMLSPLLIIQSMVRKFCGVVFAHNHLLYTNFDRLRRVHRGFLKNINDVAYSVSAEENPVLVVIKYNHCKCLFIIKMLSALL